MAGVLGWLVGSSATVATTWIIQKSATRREPIQLELRKREALYGEFIGECAKLLVDAFTHTLDAPEKLLPLYALLNRIRLCASQSVLAEAERLLTCVTDQYFATNLSLEDIRELARSEGADPSRPSARHAARSSERKVGSDSTFQVHPRTARVVPEKSSLTLLFAATIARAAPRRRLPLTKSRRNADASLTTRADCSLTLMPYRSPHSATPMPLLARFADFSWLVRPDRRFANPAGAGREEADGSLATLNAAHDGRRSARDIAAMLAASLAFALVGCATPVLKQSVGVPARFAAASANDIEPETAWWDSYRDPVLSDLVRRAARENRDVKIAAERVRAVRAGETISRSWLYPSVGINASASDYRTGYDGSTRQAVATAANTKNWQGGLEVSWEIDIAGRLRAGATAAAADTLAAEDTARGVRLLVVTDVATSYFTLVGALRQLDTVRAISAAQDETLRLIVARQRVGLATPFDVERARTDASKAHAAIPPLETLAAVSRHRIAVLIGDQAFNASAIVPSGGDIAVPTAHAGQPAALLQRRPDLLAAQAQLDAANARRQQAMAEWFPRLFLGAMFGGEGFNINGMSLGAARFTNVAAMLAMPIFNAGRTQAINDIAESGQKEAVLRYEDAIVRALEDVENTLVALDDERQRAQLLQSASASAESALGHAQSLYDRGQIDLLPLLDAQRVRLSVRVGANDANTQTLLDSVQLYKALGGGWEVFEPAADAARSPNS